MNVQTENIGSKQNRKTIYIKKSFSIGTKNETSLHADIKKFYAGSDGVTEACVDGAIIDIIKDDMLIEIQTKNFSAISKKISELIKRHKVRVVYPIAEKKWIITIDKNGNRLRKRKSTKNGNPTDIFDELIRMPKLINEDNFSLEIIMVEINEIRCMDGKGSWRRKGMSINDRELIKINSSTIFRCKEDFLKFIPNDIPYEFTTKDFSEYSALAVQKVRKAVYCMKKMGLIKECGKKGNSIIYTINV